MSLGGVTAGAMDLEEKGFLKKYSGAPKFGDAPSMIRFLEDIAYLKSDTGRLFARYSDAVIAEVGAGATPANLETIARCVVTAYGGLGYAGIEPKAFPGMFTAYGTSNRGRGDHTYAWTIQAEEGGLEGAEKLALYVASGQTGKALVDSLGLCDFFPESITTDLFLGLYKALTGIDYTAESMNVCGERIYSLERRFNNIQGRDRTYDAYVPPKLTVPLTAGAHKGRAVNTEYYRQILDAYYAHYGWTADGVVPAEKSKGS
jgi:aldehyde:ferredoxin oxidoreductase